MTRKVLSSKAKRELSFQKACKVQRIARRKLFSRHTSRTACTAATSVTLGMRVLVQHSNRERTWDHSGIVMSIKQGRIRVRFDFGEDGWFSPDRVRKHYADGCTCATYQTGFCSLCYPKAQVEHKRHVPWRESGDNSPERLD